MLLVIVYNVKISNGDLISLPNITNTEPLLVVNTFDAILRDGRWPIIGNRAPDYSAIPLPKYKVAYEGKIYIEDYFAEHSRPATEVEIGNLSNRMIVTPILVEKCLKAIWGFEEWDEGYEAYKASRVLLSASYEI